MKALTTSRTPRTGFFRVFSGALAWAGALALTVLAQPLAAMESSGPAADVQAVQHLHAEELAAFAIGLDARENSLANDVRAMAMALAKKLDPGLHAREPVRRPMTTDEALADKADREAAADHAKAREEAEGNSATAATAKDDKAKDDKAKDAQTPADDAGGDPYPPPEDLPARFSAMRYEILAREVDVAANLDLDDRAAAAVRTAALKNLLTLVGTPHWACERRLKARITSELARKDAPWSGVFSSDRLDYLTLVEKDGKITGLWTAKPDGGDALGNVVMQVQGRTANGAWKSAGGEEGTITLTLHIDGRTITGSTTGGGETHQIHGTRRDP
jgi:hypothetical protein